MKYFPLAILLQMVLSVSAQVAAPTQPDTTTQTPPAPVAIPQGSSKPQNYAIGARGADYRIWQNTAVTTNEDGETTTTTNSYTELESGMHRKAKDGSWIECTTEIS